MSIQLLSEIVENNSSHWKNDEKDEKDDKNANTDRESNQNESVWNEIINLLHMYSSPVEERQKLSIQQSVSDNFQNKANVIVGNTVLKSAVYSPPFRRVARTLHIDNFQESLKSESLLVYGLSKGDRTHIFENKTLNIIWFQIDKCDKVHDYYGNVSFVIDFTQLIERFGGLDHLYYVDEIEFPSRRYSRVLLSSKEQKDLPSTISKIDVNKHGSPIIMNKDGSYSYVSGCERRDGDMRYEHGIELMVDTNELDLIWLYQHCVKKAVNHSECNLPTGNECRPFLPGKCRKFNSQGCECPFPFTWWEAMENITLKFPKIIIFSRKKNRLIVGCLKKKQKREKEEIEDQKIKIKTLIIQEIKENE